MIYINFFRKKSTKIYFITFLIISILFIILAKSQDYYIKLGNEFYEDSYLKFSAPLKISFDDTRILNYNQTIKVDCHTALTNVYVSASEPIFSGDIENKMECQYHDYDIEYTLNMDDSIVLDENLYNLLELDGVDYVYFIKLKNWFKFDKVKADIESKYNASVQVLEIKKDSNDYKDIIRIFDVFIFIVKLLFIIILMVSVFNIIIDERKNNYLYYVLGFNRITIIRITLIKILLVVLLPIIFLIFNKLL